MIVFCINCFSCGALRCLHLAYGFSLISVLMRPCLVHENCITTNAFLTVDHRSTSLGIAHWLESLLKVVWHHDTGWSSLDKHTFGLFISLIKHAQRFWYVLEFDANRVLLVTVCANCDSALLKFTWSTFNVGFSVYRERRERINGWLVFVASVFLSCLFETLHLAVR